MYLKPLLDRGIVHSKTHHIFDLRVHDAAAFFFFNNISITQSEDIPFELQVTDLSSHPRISDHGREA